MPGSSEIASWDNNYVWKILDIFPEQERWMAALKYILEQELWLAALFLEQ